MAYLLGHMNSAFVFARLYLGIDSDWALATAPSGLVKDAWDTRLMIFVLSHLAAGARADAVTGRGPALPWDHRDWGRSSRARHKACCGAEPMVRIHLPPAVSLRTFGP